MRQITTLIFLLLFAFAQAQELKFAPGQSRAGDSVNIYNSNGTLTADRTVTQSTFDLNFENSSNNCAIRNGSILGGASQGAGIEYDDGTDVYTVSIDATQSSLLWIDQSGGGKEGNASITSTATSIGRLVSASQRNEYYADDGLSEMEMVDDQFGSPVQLAASSLVKGGPGVFSGVWLVRSGYTDDDDYITTKADLSQTDFSVSVRQATVNGVVGTPLNKLTLNATDLIVSDYPNTRDDGGTTAPINFLYTDGNGKILSSPISGFGGWLLTGNTGQTDGLDNFLGSTDDVPINFLVNNVTAGRIESEVTDANTFIGGACGLTLSMGVANTGFGAAALKLNANGDYNTAIGETALANTTASNNTGVGVNSLYFNEAGVNNTAIGFYTGRNIVNGDYNTFVGTNADAAGDYSNVTAIGAYARANKSNQIAFDSTATDMRLPLNQHASGAGLYDSAGFAIYTRPIINTTAGDAATVNAISGRVRKDVTGVTFTLTNSFITANSIIILTQADAALDATATRWTVSAGSGSATITFDAAPTSNLNLNFVIMN